MLRLREYRCYNCSGEQGCRCRIWEWKYRCYSTSKWKLSQDCEEWTNPHWM